MTADGLTRPVPPDFPKRVVEEANALGVPVRLLTPAEKAARQAAADASIDAAAESARLSLGQERHAAVAADPDLRARYEEVTGQPFPEWEGIAKEYERLGFTTKPWRTLADISDAPPADLLMGMADPAGGTLCYAAPGTGKGSTGAYLVKEAQALGLRVAIYDAERRPREWARRVSGLGGDRSAVVYFDPADLGPAHAGVPLWEAIEPIGRIVRQSGTDLLIVDSILPALNVNERRLLNDPSVPFAYEGALTTLGIPVISFGHPPKGQPEGEPFGSFGWVAAHRLTWLGVRLPGTEHRVRWRVRKANERGHVPGVLLTFAYDQNTLASVVQEDDDESTRDWVLAALYKDAQTISELVTREAEETGEYLNEQDMDRAKQRLGKAIYRMKADGWLVHAGKDGKAMKYALAVSGYRQ